MPCVLFFRKIRRGIPTKILLNLCGSLIALLVALYVSEAISHNKIGCRISNVLRYYLVMVTLLWNGVEAVNMYLMIIRVFNHHKPYFVLKAGAVAWGQYFLLYNIEFSFWDITKFECHSYDSIFILENFETQFL